MATTTRARKPAARKVSEAEQTRRSEARQQKLADAHAALESGVAALVSGTDWTAYLDTAARFHRYSANNVMLIMRQRPDATQVAGYTSWQKLGYQVRAGEIGISILAPSTRRISDEEAEKAGTPEATGQRRICGWTTTTVFDVSQTDPIVGKAQPLATDPTKARLVEGAAPEGLQEMLEKQIADAGFSFERGAPTMSGANGTTEWATRRVIVRADVSDAQAAKTTAHELAHILLGHEHSTNSLARGEVEAESVAYVVASHFGLDTAGYTFGYVTGWAGTERAAEAVRATATTVLAVGHRIVEAIEQDVTEAA